MEVDVEDDEQHPDLKMEGEVGMEVEVEVEVEDEHPGLEMEVEDEVALRLW